MKPKASEIRAGLPRSLEVCLAFAGLLAVLPLLAPAALLVKLSSPGPVMFRQQRVGRGGQPFTLFKLRSMRLGGGPEITARGDSRVTPWGRVLRATKLDELPELWNVLNGDMSFVGPRPEVPTYVDLEDPLWQQVLQARPGLTDPVTLRLRNEERLLASIEGDAQVFYRQVLLPYKLQGYAEYLRQRSAWSDLRVIVLTLLAILWPDRAPPPSREEIERAVVADQPSARPSSTGRERPTT